MQSQPLHHKAYHHIRKHKKRYVRFIAFFIFLVFYGVIEDLTAASLTGVEFDIVILITVIVIAIIFTTLTEVTETIFQKEEPKIKRMIKKEEKFIEKEEDKIKKKLKKV